MDNKNELIKREQVIESFSPTKMVRTHKHIKSIANVLETQSPAISGLAKTLDEDSVLALIELHLWQLNESMNLNNKLTEMQIIEIAIEIMSNYYYLKMEDIYLIFRKAKMGEYGKLFSSLSMIDIFTWFSTYDAQRTEIFVNENTKHVGRIDESNRTATKDKEAYALHKIMVEHKLKP